MGKIVFSPDRVRSGPDPYSSLMHTSASEVARVTFSDSNSASLPKVLNPGPDPAPAIFQIWESDTCSDSGYNHRSNRNLPMFLLKKRPRRLQLLQKLKSDSGSVFSQNFDSVSGSGPKEKRRIPPELTPALRIRRATRGGRHLGHFPPSNFQNIA